MTSKTILVVGTYDTKNDELEYMADRIRSMNGNVLTMDVSVLGDPVEATDISKHDVAEAAHSSIQAAIDTGEEDKAMQIMARGASKLAAELYQTNRIDGAIILGGSMATDLALDVCKALPLGIPKYVVSTIAFSPVISPDRLAPDIQMILWAGGLYGLNSICKSSLSQAAGAVLGAAEAAESPKSERPMVGMTSLGSSCLKYMKILKPELARRGFDLAVFHATGMGGMAFDSIAAEGGFCCVMDFALPEVGNLMFGSLVNSGDSRMSGAAESATPQILAPGCIDLIDFAGWQEIPESMKDRPFHSHNRLIKCSGYNVEERQKIARELARRAGISKSPTAFILPNQGIEEWDRQGENAHDPEALAAFIEEMRLAVKDPVQLVEINAHINDQEFADTALRIFDEWLENGTIST